VSELQYALPRRGLALEDCYFYHSMDLPGVGAVEGEWDLRGGVAEYLGGVDVNGKRVLDVGTASGFLAFEMERAGAEVVASDLSDEHLWDIVPFGGAVGPDAVAEAKDHVRRLNNSFWLAHQALGSSVQVVYGPVYELPEEIGPVDVVVFGSVLLHLRDPFLALERALRLRPQTVVVAEPRWLRYTLLLGVASRLRPSAAFLPRWRSREPHDTWWYLPPAVTAAFLGALGLPRVRTTRHDQRFCGRRQRMYTLVARR
jgi:SAM-dependent methyltransferase